MNESTAVAERPQGETEVATRPVDSVRAALERMKPQIALALPRHLTADRLLRIAMTAVQNTPKLLECDRTSLYAAIMTCAQLGLEPDGVLGQAYLVPFAGKVQFIPGYKGLITLARNSGDVTSIQAHEVRAGDRFDFSFGLIERLEHEPARSDRGEIRYFYAIARFKDGGHHWDVMTREEVEIIRDRSSGWKAAVATAKKYGKEINSPWHTDFAEMGKKTVIRRIAKYLPMSVQKAAAIADAYDSGRHATLDTHGELVIEASEPAAEAEPRQIERKESRLDKFENGDATPHDPVTGEVIEPTAAAAPAAATGAEKPAAPATGEGDAFGLPPLAARDETFWEREDLEIPAPRGDAKKPDWAGWGERLVALIAVAKAGEIDVLRSHNAASRERCLAAADAKIVSAVDAAYAAAEKRHA